VVWIFTLVASVGCWIFKLTAIQHVGDHGEGCSDINMFIYKNVGPPTETLPISWPKNSLGTLGAFQHAILLYRTALTGFGICLLRLVT
jgi:hypothetical protein